VVAQGRLGRRSDVFVADQVMAKCPSKYEMQAKRAAGVAAPHAMPGTPAPN
jgi:cytochrome c-type biogenesis protein CcmE